MPAFDVTEYRTYFCDSCHQTELLLRTVIFPDGEKFRVCDRCAEVAHGLCMEVFG